MKPNNLYLTSLAILVQLAQALTDCETLTPWLGVGDSCCDGIPGFPGAIECDFEDRITELKLGGILKFSEGESMLIPGEIIGNLTRLEYLDLGDNDFSGEIPEELGSLEYLVYLRLTGNKLTGPIPDSFTKLANLQTLSAGANKLSGPLPAEFGKMGNLRYIYLYENELSGSLPASMQYLFALKHLTIYDNKFSGNFENHFTEFLDLEVIAIVYLHLP
jgi:hypothetical protein